jgi:hypothetical protein
MALSKIDLANQVENTLAVGNGGSGVTTAADLANTGNLVKIATNTVTSGDQYITFDLSSSYDNYIIKGHSIKPATDGVEAYMQFSTDGGTSYITDNLYSGRTYLRLTVGSQSGAEQNTIAGSVQLGTDLGNDGEGSCTINLYGMNNSSNKFCDATWTAKHQTDDYTWDSGFIVITNTAINRIRCYFSSGNYTSGTMTLFGVRS